MGRCDSYDPGECTRGACALEGWVRDGWGNADQWLARARAQGFDIAGTPVQDSIVCYRPGGLYSALGHVAVVAYVHNPHYFRVREMNFVAFGVYDDRDSTLQDVAGFILPPGASVGPPGVSPPPAAGPWTVQLPLAWAALQDLWNHGFPNTFDGLGAANADLDRLRQS